MSNNTRKKGSAKGDATHAAHSNEDPAAEAGMSRDIINIPDNVLQDGIKSYPEEDRDDIQWAFSYARQSDWGRQEFAQRMDTTWSSIWKVATGYRDPTTGKLAKTDNFMSKLRDLRQRVASSYVSGFVETPVTKKIFDHMDYALAGDVDGGFIGLLYGPTGRSKTEAVREWCNRNNHGRSIYIDCPESGGLRSLMYEISDVTGVGKGKKTAALRNAIIKSFNRRRMLVVDEVKRIMPNRNGGLPRELEFIRRLHDKTRCPIFLVGTNWFYRELLSGEFSGYLEQLFGRCEPLVISEKVTVSEIRPICRAFTSRPSQELINIAMEIGNGPGHLRVLFKLLKQATAAAKHSGTTLQAKHLKAAQVRRSGKSPWKDAA